MASVDSSDIPPGFFSTFSISDPHNPASGHVVKAQKRNRRVFVCIPCHRRKLKCDKLLPCSRCTAAEMADECSYMPPPSPAANRSKRGQDRKVVDRYKVPKDITEPTKLQVKRVSSPSLSVSSVSSHLSSLTPCPSSSPSRSPSPLPPNPTNSKQTTTYTDSNGEIYEQTDFTVIKSNSSRGSRPLNGVSHWSRIACEFSEALPYLFGTDLRWQQRYCQIKSLKYLFPCLDDNVNFPFSNTNPASKSQILGSLPSDDIIDTLVNNYLDSFGATHCLFHPAQLRYEVQQFYEARSEVSDEWLAQLCMILALGAESLPDFLFSGSGQSSTEWSNIFLNAAQASFGRSSYMVAPTLCTVRTLCMMLLAKLVEAQASGGSTSGNNGGIERNSATGENSDNIPSCTNGYAPLVSLMAFTMSTARSLLLHRSSKAGTQAFRSSDHPDAGKLTAADGVETEMKRRIWVTVQLLDLKTALRAGMITMQKPGDYDTELLRPLPISNLSCSRSDCSAMYEGSSCTHIGTNEESGYSYLRSIKSNDYGFKATHTVPTSARTDDFRGDPDGLYQHKLAAFMPLLVAMVNSANSPTTPSPGYSRIKLWDARTRKLLGEAKAALLPGLGAGPHAMETRAGVAWQQLGVETFDQITSAGQMQRATVQYQHLEALANRALLALHHDSFCESLVQPNERILSRESSELSSLHAMSKAAVVDISVALLSIHGAWAASITAKADRCPSTCTNLTPSATATATVASADSPYLPLLHLPAGDDHIMGLVKPTASEIIIQQQLQQQQQHHQLQQLPLPLSGRSSPAMFGCGSDVTTVAGLPISTTTEIPTPAACNTGWLLDLCHDDFRAALLYTVLVLRATHCQGQGPLLGVPQEEASAVTTVRHSYQIMRDRSYRSVAHFEEFLSVAIFFSCFRGLRSDGNLLSQVVDATNDVEQVVVTGRRYLLWAADSFTGPDEAAALMGFNGPLMTYGGL